MAITEGTFLVGGAVRDQLLGRPVVDRDWVVVGTTPEAMRAQGYTQVGRDFPVFLHPETHEEYALARTERKISAGHQGFECHAGVDVTLEEDLLRRDLMARFAAQLGFSVAPETVILLREMAAAEALAELPAERVWQEFHKALGCTGAATFMRTLVEMAALEPWFTEFADLPAGQLLHWPGGDALQRYAGLGLLFEPVTTSCVATSRRLAT